MAKSGGRQRPTLEMVAQRAGVGRGTVSRVINGSSQVSPRTREAVHNAISELGYSPNQAARTLVTRRTDTVALVVSEPRDRLFADPFFADVIRGVSSVLHERDLQLMLTTARGEVEHKRVGDYLSGSHVDGAMLVSLHRDDPLTVRLADSGVPVVHGGRPYSEAVPAPFYVDIDNVEGGRVATRHLLEAGHERVGTITGPQDMNAGVGRLRGYHEAMEEAGREIDEDLVIQGDFSVDGGAEAMAALLDRGSVPDALFVASDMMAIGAIRTLRERGLNVPEDVALVGFDDSPMAQHSSPSLTTVHQPTVQMGREMARLLVDVAIPRTTEAETVMLETRLVIRESG
ncbi:LacI family DNA-binding transcriptional regulator [Nocardiopsis alkaliphila]|uniref:LacI family DNA-binding transcriptional regulator n=1 Tax=Nocardiopsis alkaliphila TaxID=225762 RepID=UPI00034B28E9|nr:LacI family DNA-binding transcriptional regulator [Nocardiopsis alkaliphila]